MSSLSNARIAKNTVMLYFRQIVIMLVSLYTVRVVLEVLGTEDYGIFNVVGSVVVLFMFLNTAMTNSTQRFLNFSLGRNNTEQARDVYSASFVVHAAIAALVVILAQTVGVWFFQTWLNIPSERHTAALVVYQFSIMSAVISILQTPYRATIIAYEKMSFFAMLSIIEAVLRLGVVFLLPLILFDKLIIYAALVGITSVIVLLILKLYCNRTFEIAHFKLCKDKKLFRQFLGFSGWNVLGQSAGACSAFGINALVNIFSGVIVNAAMGIATQVNTAIFQLMNNFQTAFNPQITKSYAAKDIDYFMQLIFRTSRISFFLLLFFVVPIYVNTDFLLQLWLSTVPEYSMIFIRLFLLHTLIDAIAGPLWVSIHATGDIKKYQIIGSCIVFIHLPLSFLFLWLGFSPMWVLITKVLLNILLLGWRIVYLGDRVSFPVANYLYKVIIPILAVGGISSVIIFFLNSILLSDWLGLLISCIVSTVCIGCLAYFIGLNGKERLWLKGWLATRIWKHS